MQSTVMDELKRIEGVGDASIFGSMDYAMRVWLSPDKLAKYNLTPAEISAALANKTPNLPQGAWAKAPHQQTPS